MVNLQDQSPGPSFDFSPGCNEPPSAQVLEATIKLKTNPNTTFYKVLSSGNGSSNSNNQRYTDLNQGTDEIPKEKTWKPRRRKVKGAYKVPAESEDAGMPRQKGGERDVDTGKCVIPRPQGGERDVDTGDFTGRPGKFEWFQWQDAEDVTDSKAIAIDPFKKQKKTRGRQFDFLREQTVEFGAGSLSSGPKSDNMKEEIQNIDPSQGLQRISDADLAPEKRRDFRQKHNALLSNNKVKTDVAQIYQYLLHNKNKIEEDTLAEQLAIFVDGLSRQAWEAWDVFEMQKALDNQTRLRKQMIETNIGYLKEMQMHRYREGNMDDEDEADPEDPSAVMFYDALQCFTPEEQKLIRMLIEERARQLKNKVKVPLDDGTAELLAKHEQEMASLKDELASIQFRLRQERQDNEDRRLTVETQNEVMKSEIEEKVEEIEKITTELENLRNEMDEKGVGYENQLDEKNQQIEQLEADLEMAREELKAALAAPTMSISDDNKGRKSRLLTGNLDSNGKPILLFDGLDEEEIETRKSELKMIIESSELVQQIKSNCEAEIASLKDKYDTRIESLQQRLKEQEDELSRLRDEIKNQPASGPDNTQELNDEITKLKNQITESTSILDKLKAEMRRLKDALRKAEEDVEKLRERVHQLELVEQELLAQLSEINAEPDVKKTGKAFKGLMAKLGPTGLKLGTKVFERLYNDALERLKRMAIARFEKFRRANEHWETILRQRQLYGGYDSDVPRELSPEEKTVLNASSSHLRSAFTAIPDRSDLLMSGGQGNPNSPRSKSPGGLSLGGSYSGSEAREKFRKEYESLLKRYGQNAADAAMNNIVNSGNSSPTSNLLPGDTIRLTSAGSGAKSKRPNLQWRELGNSPTDDLNYKIQNIDQNSSNSNSNLGCLKCQHCGGKLNNPC